MSDTPRTDATREEERIKVMRDLAEGWGAKTVLEKIIAKELVDALTTIAAQAKEIQGLCDGYKIHAEEMEKMIRKTERVCEENERLRGALRELIDYAARETGLNPNECIAGPIGTARRALGDDQ